MLTKKRYSIKDMVLWTRGETLIYLLYAGVITLLYKVFGFTFLNVPWTPVKKENSQIIPCSFNRLKCYSKYVSHFGNESARYGY